MINTKRIGLTYHFNQLHITQHINAFFFLNIHLKLKVINILCMLTFNYA